jgi:hypothetical protein
MKWYEIILLLLLIPVGAYLRNQTYRNVHGNATIGRDIERLWQNLKRWRRNRRERKELRNKYKYLNSNRR